MMQAVPYTRRAVQLIRNGASAADLGWAESMYASVCKTHGIRTNPDVVPRIDEAADGRKALGVHFRPASGEIMRDSVIIGLPHVQAAMFALLHAHWIKGDQAFVSSRSIIEAAGVGGGRSNFHRLMDRITGRLTPIRIWVEAKVGCGYRLRVDP